MLTIIAASQGTLAIDLDDGNYTYTPPTEIVANQVAQFGFALIDGDGDVASSTLSFNLSNSDLPPLVRDDVVITNIVGAGASIVIPDYALLYNDHDPDGQAIDVTAAGSPNSGFVFLSGDNVIFTDEFFSNNGGSFRYTGTTVVPVGSDTGGVIVNRFQEGQGQLDGTGLDEILIGNLAPNVIIGYEGDDVLIGNSGNDTLVGGPGNDLLVGGGGNDQFRMRTNTGTDIVRDFTDGAAGDDRIGFLDADPSVPGNFEFPNTFGSPEGTPLSVFDFALHTSITSMTILDNQSVVRITTAQTTAQITGDLATRRDECLCLRVQLDDRPRGNLVRFRLG